MAEASERTATGPEQTGAVILQLPPHIARFCEQVATLPPGRYIMTLTITDEQRAFWTKQRMGQIER